ncbi:carbohydrate sulfotransferase 1-like [Stylophora pistillata]|uniref:carbohydrate sulfotransferase 1-like n=1 Tax=Stylophora pistillata TaxID=50429 RepID=UPI000C03EB54|nr:carbohydrate sulfotransferase 1-like [Stylophora pistillata]
MNRKLAGNGEEETKQSVVDTSPRRTVIILAQPRSGSSLLGGAFNQNPDLFYIFEPLHGLMSFLRQEIDNAESMNFLRGILRCKFTCAKCLRRFRYKSNALFASLLCKIDNSPNKPANKCDKLTHSKIENVCKSNYNITVVKFLTPRIPRNKVESLFPLCKSTTCSMIYLVRDPRPMIFSQVKVGIRFWRYFEGHSKDNGPRQSLMLYSTKICRQIEANLRTFQNFTGQMKEKYFLLRYEDLTKNLTGTLKRVFDLTEVRMHKNTLGWVKSHTSENNKNNGDALSTNRNSKAQIDKWRLEVDPELVNIIEDSCRSVMLLLGYKPLNRSETAQYNLILSLYDDQGEH